MGFPPAKLCRRKFALLHLYYNTTPVSTCQVPKLLQFCYKSVTAPISRSHLILQGSTAPINKPALYTVYILDKLEKLELAPRNQRRSWKLETSYELELQKITSTDFWLTVSCDIR